MGTFSTVSYYVFSGVNMYAMLTGSLPFTVEPFNIKALHKKMLNRQINPLPDHVSRCMYIYLKHTTTTLSLFGHDILSREWRVIVDQVQTNYHGRPNSTIISQVIMRNPYYCRMCFKSVKIIGVLHS